MALNYPELSDTPSQDLRAAAETVTLSCPRGFSPFLWSRNPGAKLGVSSDESPNEPSSTVGLRTIEPHYVLETTAMLGPLATRRANIPLVRPVSGACQSSASGVWSRLQVLIKCALTSISLEFVSRQLMRTF